MMNFLSTHQYLPPATSQLQVQIRAVIRGQWQALMLYGSYARGDFVQNSDIDVLQVAQSNRRPYKRGNINVSPYDISSLLYLARHGSLFVLHLKTDGSIIDDHSGVFARIFSAYRPPVSYEYFLTEIRRAAPLLDCTQQFYSQNWSYLHNTLIFLLRSACFAICAERGRPMFSMHKVAVELHDPRLKLTYGLKYLRHPDFGLYNNCIDLLGMYVGGKIINPYGSFENLVLMQSQSSKLLRVLSQRITASEATGEFYTGELQRVEDLVCPSP